MNRKQLRCLDKKFRTYLAALREECPNPFEHPVKVRRSAEPVDFFGLTTLREGNGEPYFYIVLHTKVEDENGDPRDVAFDELIYTLMHEWAHTMAWTPTHPNFTDHDAEWGVAFAKCYRTVIEA